MSGRAGRAEAGAEAGLPLLAAAVVCAVQDSCLLPAVK